jgi:hypothetical protein
MLKISKNYPIIRWFFTNFSKNNKFINYLNFGGLLNAI